MPNKGHFAALVYGRRSADGGSFTRSAVRCLKLCSSVHHAWNKYHLGICQSFLPPTVFIPHPRFCHLPKLNKSYLNSWDKPWVVPSMVKSTNLFKTRNEIQYREIKQSPMAIMFAFKDFIPKGFQSSYPFFPLPRQEGDIRSQTKRICSLTI